MDRTSRCERPFDIEADRETRRATGGEVKPVHPAVVDEAEKDRPMVRAERHDVVALVPHTMDQGELAAGGVQRPSDDDPVVRPAVGGAERPAPIWVVPEVNAVIAGQESRRAALDGLWPSPLHACVFLSLIHI